MARNEEKAVGLLNRWMNVKKQLVIENSYNQLEKRPHIFIQCDNLRAALKWRKDIVKEIISKIALIEDDSLDENLLNELNDRINKLYREKRHWEKKIDHLGGPTKFSDFNSIPEYNGQYQYFGAVKKFKKVREMLNHIETKKNERSTSKRSRVAILKMLSYTYFQEMNTSEMNYKKLLTMEKVEEERLNEERKKNETSKSNSTINIPETTQEPISNFDELLIQTSHFSSLDFLTSEQIEMLNTKKIGEKLLVDRKRRELLKKYVE